MTDKRDQELADGLRAGRVEAWHALYDRYAEAVWRTVARLMGGESAEVADVVQETFLAAARSASRYDPARGALWWWLCGIARNQIALHYRRGRRLRAGSDGQALGLLRDREPSPADVLVSGERAELVRAALLELPEEYGLLLEAKYLDGASVEQIAAWQRSTESAVRSKLARARRAFREVYVRLAGSPAEDDVKPTYESA